jgi:hypothetical protein
MTASTATFADTLRSFVTLVTAGEPPSLLRLARALDELAMLVHTTPPGTPSDLDVEAPQGGYEGYKAVYDSLALRFPELGSYLVAETVGETPDPAILRNPVDDLADIIGDLTDVIWRYEHVGLEEAEWYFHFHFQVHWGAHLRGVSLHLHALMGEMGCWHDQGDGPGEC